MATIWNLAEIHTAPEPEGEWDSFHVGIYAIPGGDDTGSISAFARFSEGAAFLMRRGYEPFAATTTFGTTATDPVKQSMWFKRKAKPPWYSRLLRK